MNTAGALRLDKLVKLIKDKVNNTKKHVDKAYNSFNKKMLILLPFVKNTWFCIKRKQDT